MTNGDEDQAPGPEPDFYSMTGQEYATYRAEHGMPSASDFAGVEPWQPRYAPEGARPDGLTAPDHSALAKPRPVVDPERNRAAHLAAENTVMASGYRPRDFKQGDN
jgi:hypothetical protein